MPTYKLFVRIVLTLFFYARRYHGFYLPANQQLATIIQLCVASVQDLGLSTNTKVKPRNSSMADCRVTNTPKGSLAEKRAFLGTCFLTAV
jgi:hypothetical protein